MALAFSLLSSEKQKNRFQEISPDIDKRTVCYKRRKEAVKKSTEALFDVLDDINPLQICAQTLLFNSWFAFPKVIKRVVSEYPLEVICMLKRMHRVHYTYEGQQYTLTQLYKVVRKKRGRAKILASVVVSLGLDTDEKEIQARIVFARSKPLQELAGNLVHRYQSGGKAALKCFSGIILELELLMYPAYRTIFSV